MTTIHHTYVDSVLNSTHGSREGAAGALVDAVDVRLVNHGAPPLSADERTILTDVFVRDGLVDLNSGRGMTVCAIAIERMTRMAHTINRSFRIEEAPLLD